MFIRVVRLKWDFNLVSDIILLQLQRMLCLYWMQRLKLAAIRYRYMIYPGVQTMQRKLSCTKKKEKDNGYKIYKKWIFCFARSVIFGSITVKKQKLARSLIGFKFWKRISMSWDLVLFVDYCRFDMIIFHGFLIFPELNTVSIFMEKDFKYQLGWGDTKVTKLMSMGHFGP